MSPFFVPDCIHLLGNILPTSLISLSWNGTRVGPTAALERAHSDRARSGSKGSARVSFHPFHRGASASKKDGLATPLSNIGRVKTTAARPGITRPHPVLRNANPCG